MNKFYLIINRAEQIVTVMASPAARGRRDTDGDFSLTVRPGERWAGIDYSTMIVLGSGEHQIPQ